MKVSTIFLSCLLLAHSCDPGGTLLLKDGNNEKKLLYHDFSLTMFMDSMNYLSLGLNVKITSDYLLTCYIDSLKLFLNDKRIRHKHLYFNGDRTEKSVIDLVKNENFLSYGFLEKHKIGDKILVYGEKIIKYNESYFNVDSTIFFIPKY